MSIRLVRADRLPWSVIAREFVGRDHDVSVTFLIVEAEPGKGAALHKHPYDEVIVVLDGEATLDDGASTRVVGAGDVVVIPAEQPHGFTNSGTVPLRQIDIHAHPHFITDWLT